jgi:phosphoribosylaminoimidazole (AIR) synthetase
MFEVFNMGIGFCVVVAPADVPRVRAIIESHHKRTHLLGHAVHDEQKRVRLPTEGIVGQGKRFVRA